MRQNQEIAWTIKGNMWCDLLLFWFSSHCPHGLNAAFVNFAMMIESSDSPRDFATLRSKLLLREQRLSRQAKRVTDHPVVAMHSSFVNHPPHTEKSSVVCQIWHNRDIMPAFAFIFAAFLKLEEEEVIFEEVQWYFSGNLVGF